MDHPVDQPAEATSATRPRSTPATPATELAAWLAALTDVDVHGDLGAVVSGVSLSTARVRPGDLYAALPGTRAHGATFADQALDAGAVAVLTDPAGLDLLPPGTPAIVVPDPRLVLGRLSARVYGDPARGLRVIGVTGTQGKTTTTRLLEQGLTTSGVTSAVIGTVGTRIAGHDVKTQLTTPEAPDLHGLFAVMREHGVDACAMEVSSHALVLGRVDGVVFDVATFLNLGRDHLDFHADLDDYFAAKAGLFTPERAKVGPDQRRRRVRPPAARGGDDPDVDLLLARRRRRLAGGRRRADADRCDLHRGRPGRRGARGDRASRGSSTSPTPSPPSRPRPSPASTPARSPTASPASAGCPAGSSRSRPARTSPWSSTTPTSPTPSRPCWPRCVR